MTAPTLRPLRSELDADEQALANNLRAPGDSDPSPALDARIRTQARAALRKRPLAIWGASLAAVLAVGVGVRVIMAPTELAVPTSPAPAQHERIEKAAARVRLAPAEVQTLPEARRSERPVSDLKHSIPNASDPASAPEVAAEAARPAETRHTETRARTDAVGTALSPQPASSVSPAAAAAHESLPDAFPAAPSPETSASPPAGNRASPLGTDAREQQAPITISAPPVEEKAAKSDQDGGTFPLEDALHGADTQPAQSGPKAQTGASRPRLRPARAPASAAAEADTDATLDRALPSQRITGQPSLAQLIERARRAQQRGDADALRSALLRINRLYPGAELPGVMQEWLNLELAR